MNDQDNPEQNPRRGGRLAREDLGQGWGPGWHLPGPPGLRSGAMVLRGRGRPAVQSGATGPGWAAPEVLPAWTPERPCCLQHQPGTWSTGSCVPPAGSTWAGLHSPQLRCAQRVTVMFAQALRGGSRPAPQPGPHEGVLRPAMAWVSPEDGPGPPACGGRTEPSSLSGGRGRPSPPSAWRCAAPCWSSRGRGWWSGSAAAPSPHRNAVCPIADRVLTPPLRDGSRSGIGRELRASRREVN